MIDFIKTAYANKLEAEKDLGLPHVHWIDDVLSGLAVFAIVCVAMAAL